MAEYLALKALSSAVEGVIGSNLSNLASKEVGNLLGVRGEITYLIVELQMMKAFLKNAEEKQETDSMAREWVRLVREVSLDMENCMDKFEIYLNRRRNRPRSTKKAILKSAEGWQETYSTSVEGRHETGFTNAKGRKEIDSTSVKGRHEIGSTSTKGRKQIGSTGAEGSQEIGFMSAEGRQETSFTSAEGRQRIDSTSAEGRQEIGATGAEGRQETGSASVEGRQEICATGAEGRQETGSTSLEGRQEIGSMSAELRHETGSTCAEGRQEIGATSAEGRQETDSMSAEGRQETCSMSVKGRTETGSTSAEGRKEIGSTSAEGRQEIGSTSVERGTETGSMSAEGRQEIGFTSAEGRQEIDSTSAEGRHETASMSAEGRQETGSTSVEGGTETGSMSAEGRQEIGSMSVEGRQEIGSTSAEGRNETASMSAEGRHETGSTSVEGGTETGSMGAEGRQEIGSTSAEGRQEIDSTSAEGRHEIASMSAEGRQETGSTSVEGGTETGSMSAEGRQEIGSTSAKGRQEIGSTSAEGRHETASTRAKGRQKRGSKSVNEWHEVNLRKRMWVQRVREVFFAMETCLAKFKIYLKAMGNCLAKCKIYLKALENCLAKCKIYLKAMENCLAKFKIYLKGLPNSTFLDWLSFHLQPLRSLHVRHEIATQIQDLKCRITYISDCRLRYGITAGASGSYDIFSLTDPHFVDHRLAALCMQEDQLMDIDESRTDLTSLLSRDDKKLMVISVLGMGGIGKTTLTKRVYEDLEMAGEYFDCRAWITIRHSFNLNVLLKNIIRQVTSLDNKMNLKKIQKNSIDTMKIMVDFDNMQNKEDLIHHLQNLLHNKRYIIVLDDMWSIDAWMSIKHALSENINSSRVIVTTQIEEVANNCCADFGGADNIYKPELLSISKSMKLFENRVFGPGKHCPEDLMNAANNIITKCGGLPLAINTMAGIIKSMPTPYSDQQWNNLVMNLSLGFDTNQSLEGMKQVLLLSYNNLAYLIKPCFLYLSIFPKGHLIIRKNLIKLWVAEGLVGNQYAMSAEVVAEYYFNELVSRNLILPLEVGWNGKVKNCRIHDVMLEVLIFKSMEENMVSIHGKQSRTTLKAKNVIRRLSLHNESNQIRDIPDDVDLSQVTSLSVYGYQKIQALLPRFRLLRVLVFEYYSFDQATEKGSFLRILSKLRHLRYLSLKGTNLHSHKKKIKSTFSKSLSKLQNLVTLDIRNVGISRLYSSFAKLKQLRHLKMDYSTIELGVLRNIEDMQTLVGLEINNMEEAKEVRHLTQLTKLKIGVHSNSPEIYKPLCASLENLSGSLLSLSLYDIREQLEIFNLNMKTPPFLLQSLHIRAKIKIPCWFGSLRNLAKLSLHIEEMDELEVIKTLPNLLCLTLYCFLYDTVNLLFSKGGYQKLKILKIDSLLRIEFQMDCMPVLQKLVFSNCSELERVIGIGILSCLQEIRLEQVPKQIIEVFKLEVENHKNITKFMAFPVND